jgi:hypothetical protein
MVKYSKSEFSNQVSQAVILELLDVWFPVFFYDGPSGSV